MHATVPVFSLRGIARYVAAVLQVKFWWFFLPSVCIVNEGISIMLFGFLFGGIWNPLYLFRVIKFRVPNAGFINVMTLNANAHAFNFKYMLMPPTSIEFLTVCTVFNFSYRNKAALASNLN